MSAAWFFPQTLPTRIQGRGLAEDNFAQEARTPLEILIREALQNPLDARDPAAVGPVRVEIRLLTTDQIDRSVFRELITEEYVARLNASTENPPQLDFARCSALLIEDFGTTGLQGSYTNPDADGDGENWNAFWLREGEGAKPGPGSNGRAGQGKITYYRIGAARAVFGFTVRKSDQVRLLMGRSSLRRVYPYLGKKYERDAFWCERKNEAAFPVDESTQLERFRCAFKLRRTIEHGLSLVVPFPQDFDGQEAVKVVISEFYFPIAMGRLEVCIGGVELKAENIDAVANAVFPDSEAKQRGSSLTKGFRGFIGEAIEDLKAKSVPVTLALNWAQTSALTDAMFPSGALDQLKATLEAGGRVAVRFPILVKHRARGAQPTYFDVHLQVPDDLAATEEAYIRRDLLIGSEKHLGGGVLQKSRGLTLIDDPAMSAFLADAEEPTHLKWNASRPRLAEDYVSPKEVVRAVRQGLPRLLAFLSGQIVKRDVRALAKYFAKPSAEEKKKTDKQGIKPGLTTPPIAEPPPPAYAKPFRLESGTDWIRARPRKSDSLSNTEFPISCALQVAYEGLDQDAFKAYDPFDFDVADTSVFSVSAKGASIKSRRHNVIEFDVSAPDFELELKGFDKNVRLRARLTYKENADGATIDNE